MIIATIISSGTINNVPHTYRNCDCSALQMADSIVIDIYYNLLENVFLN